MRNKVLHPTLQQEMKWFNRYLQIRTHLGEDVVIPFALQEHPRYEKIFFSDNSAVSKYS